jgi:orotidine-5'-phosphate decarboxylase
MTEIPQLHRRSEPAHRVIVALDLPTADEALRLAESLARSLVDMGLSVFLDLKLHDIPNTVAAASQSLLELGVGMSTVHAGGGRCVAAAVEAAACSDEHKLAILAVTVLTSHADGELQDLYDSKLSTSQLVSRLARKAVENGAHGIVASPHETARLREELGEGPLLVIPGIRPAGSDRGDQARIATPASAIRDGADFLVVGRPITQDAAPLDSFRRIVDEIASAV